MRGSTMGGMSFTKLATGGESWSMKHGYGQRHCFSGGRRKPPAGDCARMQARKSYDLEKSDGARWQKVASFLVSVGACKQ